VTPVKCEKFSSDGGNKAAQRPGDGVPTEPKRNNSGAFKTIKTAFVLTLAAVVVVSITAMVKHALTRQDASRLAASIETAGLDGANAATEIPPDRAARPRQTIYRISSATQPGSKVDPMGLLFDLKSVVNQAPEAVAQVLGESPVLWPDERPIAGTLRGKYRRGKIEIGYADEGARFITIYFSRCKSWQTGANSRRCAESDEFTNYRYRQDIPGLLQALGLPKEQRPSLNDMAVLKWNGIAGIHQISVVPNDLGGINYINVVSSRLYACLLERAEFECQAY
jgi:hypothetical protein